MHTFAQTKAATKQAAPSKPMVSGAARAGSGGVQGPLLLQRQCACGLRASSASGDCPKCSRSKLQAKLSVGASNDPLETEAERVADQVLATPGTAAVRRTPLRIQRYTGQVTAAGTAPASVDRLLASSGNPLDASLRQDMEQRFGHDFSQVRVYSGTEAQRSAHDVSARAYTVGHNIVFGAGQFAPASHAGRRLLAHELTHVVQQTAPGLEGARQGSAYLARLPLPGGSPAEAEQQRTQRIQRVFAPTLSSDPATAIVEVMTIIDSIRPTETASGLYTLVSSGEVITLTQAEYDTIRASARRTLLNSISRVRTKADDAQQQYEAQHAINEDQWFVSGAVHLFGGITDPGQSIAQNVGFARAIANAAQAITERGHLSRGAQFLAQSEVFARSAKNASQAYVDRLISTAESTATVLEVTAIAAAVTVVAIGAVLAAPAIASAATAAPLALTLATATPAVPVVAAETVALAVPAAAAVAAPATAAVAVPAAAAVAVPAAVALPATAAVAVPAVAAAAVPAVAASSTLSTAALATAGVAIAGLTLSSDSPASKTKNEESSGSGKWTCYGHSAVLQIPSALPEFRCPLDGQYIDGPSISAPSEAAACVAAKHAFNTLMPRGCRPKHLACRCSKR